MLDGRKSAVLKAVVEAYADSAQPVGSGSLSDFSVSAATIRNDMALLEQEGYLRQPYTSAGRVPTQQGYRFFVDQLDSAQIASSGTYQIADFFSQMKGEIEEVLRDTAGLLSRLTDYAAVVVEEPDDAALVRSFQLVSLHDTTVMAVVVMATGQIIKHTVEFEMFISDVVLSEASSLLSGSFVGMSVSAGSKAAVSPDALVNTVVDVFSASVRSSEVDPERVYVDGASRVVTAFEAIESVSQVLSILEQQLVVVSLLGDVVDEGVTVAIGNETGVSTLSECSLVVAPYQIDGEHGGSVAVLGPTRMKYPQAMSVVATVSKQLGRRLSEG